MVPLLGEVRTKQNWGKLSLFRKKVASVIFFVGRLTHAKPSMLDMNALNVYQINIYQAHTGIIPSIFFNKFSKISHSYQTSSKSRENDTIPKSAMKWTNLAISRRGSIL